MAKETINYITTASQPLWDHPKALISVRNGLINLDTGAFIPHSKDYISTKQLPIEYDPNATCPRSDEFFRQVLREDAGELVYELLALLIDQRNEAYQIVLLVGEGANGKSLVLYGIAEFIGKENISTVLLDSLEHDKFAPAQLDGKMVNINADIPDVTLRTTGVIKSITGGDPIPIEEKYERKRNAKIHAKLLFSANHLPRSKDLSKALFDRFYIVPFQKSFPRNPARGMEIKSFLADPQEQSGVLNRVLAVSRKVRKEGLSMPESVKGAIAAFRDNACPLRTWLEEQTEAHSDGYIPMLWLRRAFNLGQAEKDEPDMERAEFGRKLGGINPNLQHQKRQRMVDGKRVWVYTGIRFKDEAYWQDRLDLTIELERT